MRKRKTYLGWQLDAADPLAIPNARIALALLRCVRRLPGTLHEHVYDDFGIAIAPAVHCLSKDLHETLVAHHAAQTEGIQRLNGDELDSAEPLLDRTVLTLLGMATSKRLLHFQGLLDKVEARLERFVERHPHPTDRNVQILAKMLTLPAPEQAFLRLAAAFGYGTIDRALFNFVASEALLMRVLEVLCGADQAARLRMFDPAHPLGASGLLEFSATRRSTRDLDDLLTLTSLGQRLLSCPFDGPKDMSMAVLEPLPAGGSASLNWPHLADQQALLRAALHGAIKDRTPGFNVLIHGAPGTGKTEFVRQLVMGMGAQGFQVTHAGESGSEASRSDRLAGLHLCQTFADCHEGAVLVLDEAEDIFTGDYNNPLARLLKRGGESKAWMNHLLESNAHPVIWICNQVQHLDPAYLRRFALAIEFPRAPFAQRLRIASEKLQALGCSQQTIEQVASSELMTPAMVASAARLVRLGQGSAVPPDQAVRLLVQGHCQASGQPVPREFASSLTRFDTRYLNLTGAMSADQLVRSIQEEGCANVLFHGAPGTGKTQFAVEIARQLGRRLVVRTASDINSKWYGQSEANVARMFKDCDVKAELLFLDEADVLLGAREASDNRAERSVTAEFLRWLECFGGLFICATNHARDFDRALMRRFVFRVGFEPLTLAQRIELLGELALNWLPAEGGSPPGLSCEILRRLQALDQLTAGDFANVARRLKRVQAASLVHWVEELSLEQGAKADAPRARIGFV